MAHKVIIQLVDEKDQIVDEEPLEYDSPNDAREAFEELVEYTQEEEGDIVEGTVIDAEVA